MERSQSSRVRFGPFELDLRAGELHANGNGQPNLLPLQVFQILQILIEHEGGVVPREEIKKKLWPEDTVVEFDHSINAAIKKLRKALDDSADEPKYVETIPRRGYRLIVPVEWVIEPENEKAPVQRELKELKTSRRKRLLLATLAVLTAAPVLGGVFYSRVHPKFRLTDKDALVLADVENTTGDPVLDGILTEALRIALEQTPFLNLLAPDKVNRVGKEIGLSNEQTLTLDTTRQVCLKSNSAALVSGSISDAGNGYRIALRALRCKNGDVMASADGLAEQRSGIVKELGRAAATLRAELGEPAKSLEEFNQPLEIATTSSVEALKSFTAGKQARAQKGDDAAAPLFRRAVELDPNFALAHSWLAVVQADDFDREERQRAYDLRDRVTKRQYFEITGKYYEMVTGELEKAKEYWTEMAKVYPTSVTPHYRLGVTLHALGRYDDSVAEAREAIRLEPGNFMYYVIVMESEDARERYAESNSAFDDAISHHLDNSQLRVARYTSALLQNDRAAMREQLRVLRQMGPAWRASRAEAWAEIASGHLNNERQVVLNNLVSNKVNNQHMATSAFYLADLAIAEEELGDLTAAKAHARRALAISSERFVKLHAAYALARAGDLDQAEQRAHELEAEVPDDTLIKNYGPCVDVTIAMTRNATDQALDILQTSCPNNPAQPVQSIPALDWRYLRGLVYLKRREAEKAKTAFQSVIDHPGIQNWMGPFWGALARIQLARAQVMMGDKEAAHKSYQDFLALWKDADADIPIYRQAKAEYAKLRKSSQLPAVSHR